MPTAVEYAVMLASPSHASTAIEYGLTNPAHAQVHVESEGNPWHGKPLVNDGYTWSNSWHTQGAEVGLAPPAPASEDWQLVGVFAAALLVLVAIAIAVRRRLASR